VDGAGEPPVGRRAEARESMPRQRDSRVLALIVLILLDCRSRNDSLTPKKLSTRRGRAADMVYWLWRFRRQKVFAFPDFLITAVRELVDSPQLLRLLRMWAAATDGLPPCVVDFLWSRSAPTACVEEWAFQELGEEGRKLRERLCSSA
jgi:hypothetical protein